MDTTAVVTAISGIETDIFAIGGAIILLAAAVFSVRWIKAQFF